MPSEVKPPVCLDSVCIYIPKPYVSWMWTSILGTEKVYADDVREKKYRRAVLK